MESKDNFLFVLLLVAPISIILWMVTVGWMKLVTSVFADVMMLSGFCSYI